MYNLCLVKQIQKTMLSHRYCTIYTDRTMFTEVCELIHFAPSLPDAIKYGRSFVRDLNHSEKCRPGMKRYHYENTYRAR